MCAVVPQGHFFDRFCFCMALRTTQEYSSPGILPGGCCSEATSNPPPPRPLLCITGTICHPSRVTAVSLQSHLLLYTKKVSPCKLYSRHSFTTHCQTREKAASFHVQVFCRILNNYLCYPLHTCAPSDSDNTVTHHKSPAAGRGAVPTMVLCSCHTLFPQGNLLTAARSLAQRKKTF